VIVVQDNSRSPSSRQVLKWTSALHVGEVRRLTREGCRRHGEPTELPQSQRSEEHQLLSFLSDFGGTKQRTTMGSRPSKFPDNATTCASEGIAERLKSGHELDRETIRAAYGLAIEFGHVKTAESSYGTTLLKRPNSFSLRCP